MVIHQGDTTSRLTKPSRYSIQVYNLFGEQGDLPDVVHCEGDSSGRLLCCIRAGRRLRALSEGQE
jgi:hypothetical protein